MMKENVNVDVKRIFRLRTRQIIRDLSGNEIAVIWITRGDDGNKIVIEVIDPKLEVVVKDASV